MAKVIIIPFDLWEAICELNESMVKDNDTIQRKLGIFEYLFEKWSEEEEDIRYSIYGAIGLEGADEEKRKKIKEVRQKELNLLIGELEERKYEMEKIINKYVKEGDE